MKTTRIPSLLAALALAAATAAAAEPLVVACVGDSITYGHGASDRARTSYPAQLQALLGDGWKVLNFGHNARTALDEGKEWNGQGGMGYRKSPEFAKAKDCKPDVVLFMLGTNDSKPVNWGEDGAGVKRDYAQLVDDFLALNPAPVVVIGASPFVKKDSFSIREKIVGGDLAPWQRAFAAERGLPLVDAYEALKARAADGYLGDGVHPNDAGYGVLAEAFAAKLRELEPSLKERRPPPPPRVVACVGDSITWGGGGAACYPALLQAELGEGWKVLNFGVNSRTARREGKEFDLRPGDLDYRKTLSYTKSLSCKPDAVILMIGTNDSKPPNWEETGDAFREGYAALVEDYLALDPRPVVVIGISPTVKGGGFTYGVTEKIVGGGVVPVQRKIAEEKGLPTVDCRAVLDPHMATAYSGDGLHPNAEGNALLAAAFAARLRELFSHAEEKSHAESAENAELESHAESAEGAEPKPHAESAEGAEPKPHAEPAKGAK